MQGYMHFFSFFSRGNLTVGSSLKITQKIKEDSTYALQFAKMFELRRGILIRTQLFLKMIDPDLRTKRMRSRRSRCPLWKIPNSSEGRKVQLFDLQISVSDTDSLNPDPGIMLKPYPDPDYCWIRIQSGSRPRFEKYTIKFSVSDPDPVF
jgi:hypothetical protein